MCYLMPNLSFFMHKSGTISFIVGEIKKKTFIPFPRILV